MARQIMPEKSKRQSLFDWPSLFKNFYQRHQTPKVAQNDKRIPKDGPMMYHNMPFQNSADLTHITNVATPNPLWLDETFRGLSDLFVDLRAPRQNRNGDKVIADKKPELKKLNWRHVLRS